MATSFVLPVGVGTAAQDEDEEMHSDVFSAVPNCGTSFNSEDDAKLGTDAENAASDGANKDSGDSSNDEVYGGSVPSRNSRRKKKNPSELSLQSC